MLNEGFKNRVELLEFINKKFKNGIGVEIGVAGGHFTQQIVKSWKTCQKLFAVDLWEHQDEGYNDGCNLSNDVQLERYNQVLKDFSIHKHVSFLKMWSHVAVNQFYDNHVDFIYLDANHSYQGCMNDLNIWYPKIKKGGIFAGHDYSAGVDDSYNVKKAVDEFTASKGIKLFHTLDQNSPERAFYGASWEGHSFYFEKID
jgi:23S rRNA U2552 (ribose-2'-O)-methylase RlmE/FtsJ